MGFKEVKVEELPFNPFTKIGSEWMLITAGTEEKYNTMTASWGGAGILWNKNVVTCYIRPQRYTKEFVDANDTFTISFFGPEYKNALTICGRKSGRDCDKITEAGLTPCFFDGTPSFREASLVLVCKKLYIDTIKPQNILDPANDTANYPQKDYHTMYIAEILKAYQAE